MNAIIGDTSVDDAVEQVVKDINIYLYESERGMKAYEDQPE